MSRLTPEREQEIRKTDYLISDKREDAYEAIWQLLAEIDALRAELEWSKHPENMTEYNYIREIQKERDILRGDFELTRGERDQLKAENEKMRLFLNPMTAESIRIEKENQKLRERIAKLRAAIGETPCCQQCIPCYKTLIEALAQDDEESGT